MGSRWIRTGAAVAATLLCAAAAVLSAWVDARVAEPPASTIGGVYSLVYAATGALLVHLRPRNAIGWLFVLTGLLQALSVGGGAYGGYGVDVADPVWPLAGWAALVGSMLWLPSLVLPATVLVALYPSGELPARWWRWPVGAVSVGLAVLTVVSSLTQSAYDDTASGPAPVDLPRSWWIPVAVSAGGAVLGGAVTIWVATVVRLVRARPPERQQLAWLVCVVLPLMLAVFVLPDSVEWLILPLGLMVPGAVVVGVVRYRLLGIMVSRALVYAALTAAVVVLYLAGAALVAAALGRTLSPVTGAVAAALLAVALNPARTWLQSAADRFVYGSRRDPVTAVTELGDRVADADEAELLPAVLDTVTTALRVPAAQVLPPGEPADRAGAVAVPLRVGGRDVGALRVAERHPGEPFTAGDLRLLAALAPQVAVVVRALELTGSLERERDRVLAATHAERDRIRRDLHDGVGPSLAGIGLGVQAVQAHLREPVDPRTGGLLTRLRDEVDDAVGEVRRILDGLRPGSLDDAGLVAAVGRHADALAPSVPVRVIAGELPPLPPEVETAAYRIAQEALTNVVRHSGARSAEVGLRTRDGRLEVAVADDGAGFATGDDPGCTGVGLESMRARARAVGGDLTVTTGPDGTRVVAGLPLEASR
ncbi:signal transduction histidine kinase [Geodermatophilus bullaregiensis]|uniref:sensor histidine kinase n=1 Tax=Geodermatophilus bullaregiensis TaxID=1564160 RepID=UPI00195D92C8|nr:GAF domain-containing sensor histidine kinase [Geodermatophilus bullaregiensis]MBM7807893.1 signal transduction histidine kinase [Geodermatophilus bullaregiensis]